MERTLLNWMRTVRQSILYFWYGWERKSMRTLLEKKRYSVCRMRRKRDWGRCTAERAREEMRRLRMSRAGRKVKMWRAMSAGRVLKMSWEG